MLIYIYCISWTQVFRIHPWLPVHVVLGISIFILFFLTISIQNKKLKIPLSLYHSEDIFLILGIIFIIFSAIINAGNKSINYILAYIYIFIIGYLLFKGIFFLKTKAKKLLMANALGVLFVCMLAVLETLLYLLFDINIQNYIPRGTGGVGVATYLDFFHRSYAFATEPTILAFYLNTLGPIGLWQWWQTSIRKIWKIAISILFFLALISTFSPTVFTFLPFAFLVSLTLVFFDSVVKKKKILLSLKTPVFLIAILLIVVLSSLCLPLVSKVKYFSNGIYEKITLESQTTRTTLWETGIKDLQKNPLVGKGIGTTVGVSNINWYIYLAKEGGMISLLPFLIFFALTIFRILKSRMKGKRWFLTGFLAGIMHLAVISTFFHPFIWVLLIIFNVYETEYRYQSTKHN